MKRIAKKSKEAIFYVIPPETLMLGFLGFLYWGSQVALVGFVLYKVYEAAVA